MIAVADAGGELEVLIQSTTDLVPCPACGVVARAKDRRPSWVRDLPFGGRPVLLCWWKRVWCCPQPACGVRTWTEQHEAIAPRAVLTEQARQWAFEQVGDQDAAVSTVAAQLGVAWWTVMTQVIDRGTPLVEDPTRLTPVDGQVDGRVTAIGVDETAFLRATGQHPTLFATGIAELTPGRSARLLDVVEGRSGSVLADWLAGQEPVWRAAVTTASLDPFRGYATALTAELPDAARVLDPFYGDLRVMPRSGPLGLVAGPSAVRRSA